MHQCLSGRRCERRDEAACGSNRESCSRGERQEEGRGSVATACGNGGGDVPYAACPTQ